LYSLYQTPDANMRLTQKVITQYNIIYKRPFDDDSNPHFIRDCPTNLAMMDIWSEEFYGYVKFVASLCLFVIFTLPCDYAGFLNYPFAASYRYIVVHSYP
jgi:hypothetical protein